MSRVEIEAGGRKVVIEHDGELEHLRESALTLWQRTEGPERLGAAFGFQAPARWTPPVQPSGMRVAPGPYPVQGCEES